MSDIDALLEGFRKFREIYYQQDPELYRDQLAQGQNPRFAVVACSDSRVDPAIVLQAEPGDIFSVRNVAALVPPYEEDGHYHGTSAALEFAVEGLGVDHIVIIGHVQCGGVEAMVRREEGETPGGEFVTKWTDLLREARHRALAEDPGLSGDELLRASERQAVLLSLDNLMTFPFIQKAVQGRLSLHGWYLNMHEGTLEGYNPSKGAFETIS
jgi:carbonic anhydrase